MLPFEPQRVTSIAPGYSLIQGIVGGVIPPAPAAPVSGPPPAPAPASKPAGRAGQSVRLQLPGITLPAGDIRVAPPAGRPAPFTPLAPAVVPLAPAPPPPAFQPIQPVAAPAPPTPAPFPPAPVLPPAGPVLPPAGPARRPAGARSVTAHMTVAFVLALAACTAIIAVTKPPAIEDKAGFQRAVAAGSLALGIVLVCSLAVWLANATLVTAVKSGAPVLERGDDFVRWYA